MKIKSLYCGGGFIDSQLLWLIIVIDGYCNKNNIRNIIFVKTSFSYLKFFLFPIFLSFIIFKKRIFFG